MLGEDTSIDVVVEHLDLSVAESAMALQQRLGERGIRPEVLINNAGFGFYEFFLHHDPERLRAMLQLDIVNLVELSQIFGRQVALDGRGRILPVGRMAAYQPVPMLSAYAAAKTFVLSFVQALHVELTRR